MHIFKYEVSPDYQAIVSSGQEEFRFFWGGEFSQWHPSPFAMEGRVFPTAEHYMMFKKAMLFNDSETAMKVLAEPSPREVKQYGREIQNFDPILWEANKIIIVTQGSFAKFTQNVELRRILLDTQGSTLVEASPEDKIWGIGLAETDDRVFERELWQGENLLGRILTDIRFHLLVDTY